MKSIFLKCFFQPISHIVVGWLILHGRLDAIGQEAEDSTGPKQHGEPPKHLLAELHPLWCGGGRRQGIGSIPSQDLCSPRTGQTLGKRQGYISNAVCAHYVECQHSLQGEI